MLSSFRWKARIGVILPVAVDTVTHPHSFLAEYYMLVPRFVSVHITGYPINPGDIYEPVLDAVLRVSSIEGLATAAKMLAKIPIDSIAYACTSASFIRGAGFDRRQIEAMEKASGRPATTTSTAAVEAFKALGVDKVAVAAVYVDEICEKLRKFLEGNGISVTRIENLNLKTDADIMKKGPEDAYRLAKKADTPDAQAVFIPDTGFRCIDVIDALESELGKPIVTANQATMWHAQRLAGIREPLAEFGKLMKAM
jgi:maleate isomerase